MFAKLAGMLLNCVHPNVVAVLRESSMVEPSNSSAQKRFDAMYISSREIMDRLKVTRPTISQARARGLLPDPIVVSDMFYIWERAPVEPFLSAWQTILGVKRSKHA